MAETDPSSGAEHVAKGRSSAPQGLFDEHLEHWCQSLTADGGTLRPHVAIVGAGIIGLSIAELAARLGYIVRVFHDRPLLGSTSAMAAGLIEPVAPPESEEGKQLVLDAFACSFEAWAAAARLDGQQAVVRRTVTGYRRIPWERPDWAEIVDGYQLIAPAELPPSLPRVVWGERFTTYVVDPCAYITRKALELAAAGVTFEVRFVGSPTDLVSDYDAVVNATGIGAARFVGDTELYRCDGHVATVPRSHDISEVIFDWDSPSEFASDGLDFVYVVARANDVVLGGTLREGATIAEGEPRQEDGMAQRLLHAAQRLVPTLDGPILSYSAASRPMRRSICLGSETLRDQTPLVHCFGTGGSGWTLAPGLARTATEELARCIPPPRATTRRSPRRGHAG